jgi:hypothetical protein
MPRLPKSVEKQAELADKVFQEAYGTPQSTSEAPKAPETEPPVQAETTPASSDSAPAEEHAKLEPSPPRNPDNENDIDYWKRRVAAAEGRLKLEQPRMAQTIRELKDQLAQAQAKLAEVKTAAPASSVPDGVKPEEVEQYGKDFIDMVQRVARNATPGVDPKLQDQVQAVAEQQRKISRDQFFDSLKREAPQWESLNTDEGFLAHLAGLDPYTGRPRQELFDDAYEKLDAWRIANFFNSYQESRQVNPEPPKPSLANQVVPAGNKASTPPPGKKVWTTAEVARFYDELRRGVHNEESAARIEQDIFAAQSEGRLR